MQPNYHSHNEFARILRMFSDGEQNKSRTREEVIRLEINPFLPNSPVSSNSSYLSEAGQVLPQRTPKKDNITDNVLNQLIRKIINLKVRFDKYEKENQNHRNVQNKLIIETLVYVKKINRSLLKVVGEEGDNSIEFETIFPLKTIAELSEMELRVNDYKYVAKLVMFLRKLKGSSTLDSVFRFIATDQVYHEFNLKGKAGNRSLKSLKLFDTVLFDACSDVLGKENYEKEIRICIQHAHNRFFKNKK